MKKFALFLILSILLSTLNINPVGAISCKNYHIIFARGSGQELNGPDYQKFKAAFQKYFPEADFYELGSKKQTGFKYPAVSIANLNTLVGAKISAGKAYDYGESVKQGINELEKYIKDYSLICPGTRFILGGYSQGAQVISSTLPKLDAKKVAYVATFGDPKLYLPEGYTPGGTYPPACFRQNLSNYRVNIPDCLVYEGILNATRPYQTTDYINKLGAWCNIGDIICGSYLISKINPLKGHLKYQEDGSFSHAARAAYKAINRRSAGTSHDLAILIDTTASMDTTIEKYINQAKRLAKNIIDKGGRVALYDYRDYYDRDPVLLCDFDCSYDSFVSKLSSLSISDGGDPDESALSAIITALNTLKWQKGATKSIVLLTDAGFHNPDRDKTTLEQVIRRAWEIDPVNIYAITGREYHYTELTEKTGGRTFNIDIDAEFSTDFLLEKEEEEITTPYLYTENVEIPSLSLIDKTDSDTELALKIDASDNFTMMSVAINDTLLAFTSETNLNLDNLPDNYTVSLTPFSTTGHRGKPLTITKASQNSPSQSTRTKATDVVSTANTYQHPLIQRFIGYNIPKIPNTGAH